LIKANVIRAVSATTADATGLHVSAAGSKLVNLVIGGKAIPITPSPNTTITLPGIGKVTLNEQIPIANGTTVCLTVNMIDVDVLVAQAGLTVGTRIIIGHATSGLAQTSGADDEVIGGSSFATAVRIGGLVVSSPTFPAVLNIGIGCGSVLNGTSTDTGVGVQIPGIISSGTLSQTATGALNGSLAVGDTTSSIEHLSILGGLVKANVIKAESNAVATPTSSAFSAAGSQLVGLSVGGKTIPINVAPNTHISIAGLTIWINRVIRTANSLEVRMLEVTGFSKQSPVNGGFLDIVVADAKTQT